MFVIFCILLERLYINKQLWNSWLNESTGWKSLLLKVEHGNCPLMSANLSKINDITRSQYSNSILLSFFHEILFSFTLFCRNYSFIQKYCLKVLCSRYSGCFWKIIIRLKEDREADEIIKYLTMNLINTRKDR
jgi:hypothetical protein